VRPRAGDVGRIERLANAQRCYQFSGHVPRDKRHIESGLDDFHADISLRFEDSQIVLVQPGN